MNIIATIGAGIVSFMIGALWYTVLFGKTWIKEIGFTEEDIKNSGGGALPMVFTLLIEVCVSFLVVYLLTQINLPVLSGGLLIAAIAIASALKNYLFEKKSLKLIFINESYKFVCIIVMTVSFMLFS